MFWRRLSLVAFACLGCLALPALGEPLDRAAGAACVPDAQTLCLNSGQFAVTVNFDDGDKTSGPGMVLPVASDSWGFFYLDDGSHLELFAQILDGCSINNFYWVILIGLSDFEQTVTISEAGMVAKTYDNLAGNYFAVSDTMAIPCAEFAFEEVVSSTPPGPRGAPASPPLTLDRFKVTVEWEDFTMNTGNGQPVEVTPHSGYFWFFNADNPEVVVKIVDNSSVNGNFWLFFGSLTTVEHTLRVLDPCDGSVTSFMKPAGVVGGTVVDMSSFPFAASCLIFSDGFESGGTAMWSAVVGLPE